jgi:hypothetical protein
MTTPTLGTPPPLHVPAGVPIALLPVRLETRYHDGVLKIRIYPDRLHVDAHEPGLSATEADNGLRYWASVAQAGKDATALAGAWAGLVAQYGPERAAWVARRTRDGRPPGAPKSLEWASPPLARLLPTRWRAAGWARETPEDVYTQLMFDVAGRNIPPELALGPDPASTQDPDPDALTDPGMAWLVDYAEAEAVGMAITITPEHYGLVDSQNLDRLIVYGVDETADEPGATLAAPGRLAALLQAHHYTDGIGFVAPGTPTNNTAGERSGYAAAGAALDEHYRRTDGSRTPLPQIGAGTVAGDLAHALGLGPARAVLELAGGGDRVDAQASMNTAVWASTWGYFLFHILDGVGLDAIGKVRRHFIDHVRAGGALPVLRVGDQPYGVLPVLAIPLAGDGGPRPMTTQLRDLLAQWTAASRRATVGATWPDPPNSTPDLERYYRLLTRQPMATAYAGRSAIGPEYMSGLWRFLRLDLADSWRDAPRETANNQLWRYGLPLDQRHTGTVFAAEAFDIDAPVAGPDTAAFLERLRTLSPAGIAAEAMAPGTPLLHRVLRNSALQEFWNAALRVKGGGRELIEDELVDLDTEAPPTPTMWRLLAEPYGPRTIGEYIATAPADDPAVADLHEFRAALAVLAGLPADELESLLRGSLDLAAHRLDAWVTSYANERLAAMRGAAPDTLAIGGFGWLTNVGPAELTAVPKPPRDEPAPLYHDKANAGHVLAPSMQHAATAAVLHAGYVARGGRERREEAVAVNLGASRVRLARHLAEGVRAGQSLGALLGYRLERELASNAGEGVPGLVTAFRLLAPSTAQVLTPGGPAGEVTRRAAVADGVALVERWRVGGIPWGTAPDPDNHPDAVLPAIGTWPHSVALKALKTAADAIDALADAGLAEGVHQLVGGNHARAGAVLDALAKGEAPPPDLEVVQTPRTGAVHTHRLILLGSEDQAADLAVWPTDGYQFRANVEPTLNGWAGRMLGDPARVRCRGLWRAGDGTVLASAEITLDQLRLSPLDLVALSGADRDGAEWELRQRFVSRLRLERPAHVPDLIMPVPDFGRQPAWPRDVLSVAEIRELAGAVRAVLLGARLVRGADLAGPGEEVAVRWDVAGAANGVIAATHALTRHRAALAAAADTGDIGAMGGQLTALSYFGVTGAYPEVGRDWTDAWREELRITAKSTIAEVDRRLVERAELAAGFDDRNATDRDRAEHQAAQLRCLLGPDFPAVPRFVPERPAAVTELLSHSAALLGGDPLATATWLDRLARVRPAADRLHRVFAYAEATGATATTDLLVAQLPYDAREAWVALPPREARVPGRTALAVHSVRPVDPSRPLTGLVLDEWTEMVPNDSEVAGLAFHYDAPSSRAPQAILLAMADRDREWEPPRLRDTIAQAMDVAQARAVDLQTLDQHGHFLPALYFAFNESGATISTDFTRALQMEGK